MTAPLISMIESPMQAIAAGAAEWLRFAAAPTFAVMALLAGTLGGGGGMANMPGMPGPTSSPLTGMVVMYALMGLFHLGPWLKLIAGRHSGNRRS